MKASDRSILVGLFILGLLAVFWFMLLSPKREKASELEAQVETLRSEVTQQEELAQAAVQAQADYEKNFSRLVTLGKAAPANGDTPSLIAQLTELSERSETDFISLTQSGEAEAAAPAAAQTTTDQNQAAAEGESATPPAGGEAAPPTPVAAPPTEASAASLPLGATVGPAGLGVMPYTLQFAGDFFGIADLMAGFDDLVSAGKRGADVSGRLLTINGFSLSRDPEDNTLAAELSLAAYVLPDSQGLTAGATPTAPPPSVPQATPVSTATTPAVP